MSFWSYICHHCKTVLQSDEYQWSVRCHHCKKKVDQFDLFGKDLKFSPMMVPTPNGPKDTPKRFGGEIKITPKGKMFQSDRSGSRIQKPRGGKF